MTRRSRPAQIRGFSLVEVMVAVVVICTGLLGIAKLQALSLSNTSTARLRSLAAMEAARPEPGPPGCSVRRRVATNPAAAANAAGTSST